MGKTPEIQQQQGAPGMDKSSTSWEMLHHKLQIQQHQGDHAQKNESKWKILSAGGPLAKTPNLEFSESADRLVPDETNLEAAGRLENKATKP